jgi:tRNA nucleotidyltransferase/poly(A) polymerase
MPQNQNKLDEIPTPLTDEFARQMYKSGIDCHHDGQQAINFARQLERANAALVEENKKLNTDLVEAQCNRNEVVSQLRSELATYKEKAGRASKTLADMASMESSPSRKRLLDTLATALVESAAITKAKKGRE